MTGISAEVAEVAEVTKRLRHGMAGGVLSFPLTSFREDGRLDLDAYRAYLTGRPAIAPGAVFPACGTGEFFSLDEDEYAAVIEATVEIADGRLPVVAGTRLPVVAYQRGQVAFTAASLRRIAQITGVTGLKDGHNDLGPVLSCPATSRDNTTQALNRLRRRTLGAPGGFLFFNGASTAEIQALRHRRRSRLLLGLPRIRPRDGERLLRRLAGR